MTLTTATPSAPWPTRAGRVTGKKNGPNGQTGPFWDLLYSHNAELVLNGHKHAYARFAE